VINRQKDLDVSVVMPVYNGARHLTPAIESVLAQTWPACEFIVVNDGSTDSSADILRRFGSQLTVLDQANGGQSLARRRGCELAQGSLIAFLDQDDVWDRNKLARQVDLMQRFPDAVATYCDHRRIDDTGTVIGTTGAVYGLRGSGYILDALMRGNFILSTSLVMARRATYELAGGFTSERCFWSDDFSLWMRLAAHGAVIYQAETLVSYRQHAGNTSGNLYEQTRGDAHAFEELCRHLQTTGRLGHLPKALNARSNLLKAAAWHCRKRGEWGTAMKYWWNALNG
jgi:glycosyltransferase involved in cell wall biosynthesis